MITKPQFLKALNKLASQDLEDTYISTHLQCVCPESNVLYVTKYAQTGLLDLLEAVTHDEGHWISYWLYDLQHGEKHKPGCVRVEGKHVRLKTPDDLYRMLVRNWKGCKKI